jgi:outer membrane protein assembly factor BamB
MLHCLDFQKGVVIWSKNVKADVRAAKGFFGIACSPLVEGNAVLLNAGGREGAGIIALDRKDGKLLWKASNDEASYSSPTSATVNGRHCAFVLTRANLVSLDPATGKIQFQYPFRPPINSSVTAATPLVIADSVFISASYDTGATLLKFKESGFEKVWSSEDAISSHYATCIHHDGFLYGIHGRTDPGFEPPASLRCIELATGKVRWQKENFGAAVLTLAGDDLLILTERGELIRVPASPAGFKETARAQVLSSQVRAHPAIADGYFYARSKDKLVCVDLRKRG